MAKRTKPEAQDETQTPQAEVEEVTATEDVIDAEIVEPEEADASQVAAEAVETAENSADTTTQTDAPQDDITDEADLAPDESTEADPAPENTEATANAMPDQDTVDAPEQDHEAPTVEAPIQAESAPAAPVVEQTVIRKGGAGAMMLGGLVAAGLGYGAAYLGYGQQNTTALETTINALNGQVRAQKSTIDGLNAELAAVKNTLSEIPGTIPDLAPVQQTLADTGAHIAALSDTVASQLAAVDERLTSVELRGDQGEADLTAVTAYERELKELRDQLQGMAETASTRIASLEENATTVATTSEQLRNKATEARKAAEKAQAEAALAQLNGALSGGGGFSAALATLAPLVEIPPALSATAKTGVPVMSDLAATFPEAARNALSTTRAAGTSGENSGKIGAFLRKQFNLRSTTPREGDGVDAVLSRAEAALRAGNLPAALNELQALPDDAKSAIADWQTLAQTRADAIAAAAAISQQLMQE